MEEAIIYEPKKPALAVTTAGKINLLRFHCIIEMEIVEVQQW